MKWNQGLSFAIAVRLRGRPKGYAPAINGLAEPQPLLASQDAIDPAFLVGAWGIKCGERLCEFPEAGIAPGTILHDEPLHRLGTPKTEDQHGLVYAIENRRAGLGRSQVI